MFSLSYLCHGVDKIAGNAKVTHFDFATAGDEDVARLHVPMDDLEPGVQVVKGAHNAVRNQPVPRYKNRLQIRQCFGYRYGFSGLLELKKI